MSASNKDLVRSWFEDGDRNRRVSGGFVTSDFVAHLPGSAPPIDFSTFQQQIATFYQAFSGMSHTFEEIIAEGDIVAFRILAHATHTGELMGIPASGKEVSISQIGMARVADGKIAELWNNTDQLGAMRQIGAIPAPGQASPA